MTTQEPAVLAAAILAMLALAFGVGGTGCAYSTPGGYVGAVGMADISPIVEEVNMSRLPASVYASIKQAREERTLNGARN